MTDMIETQVNREFWDVDRRLSEIGLTRSGLLDVVVTAITASADATPFHPANAAGTFSYQQGTWKLRNNFVGSGWELDRSDGVEAILNRSTKVKVMFANVDIACSEDQPPKPRSRKGAGAERACSGNLFGFMPIYAPRQENEWATYYLMVDADGAAELTRPVVKGNTFSAYIERNYLSDGGTFDGSAMEPDQDDGSVDFDPQVARK